jgi:choline dehydrogenase-like flavoprotein
MAGFRLLDPQRRTLDALCRRIIPAAYVLAGSDVAAAVERRLAGGDPVVAAQVATLLTVFDHPAVALISGRRTVRFTECPAEVQDQVLAGWETSRLGVKRTVFQAFRRLVLSTYYADPAATRALGARAPLHTRAPELPWEGPLDGEPTDGEPVLRTNEPWRPATPTRTAPLGVTHGHALPADAMVRAEVCVIGTGAGGAVAAARLAELGHDVVLLEEGAWWNPADFTENEAEMTPRLYAEAGARATADLSVSILQGRAVGGSALVNWLIMLRTPEWVLDEWTRQHGAEGMTPHDLTPVFDLVERETHTRCVPDDAHSPINQAILDGAMRLGWRARGAKVNTWDCVRAGTCGLGCRFDAKQRAATVYVPRALAAGARLYADVRADRVEVVERSGPAPRKRVHATVLDRATGTPRGRLTVEAPIVVLAGGAVGTPSILLRSALGGPCVGRYLRLHPTTAVMGVYDQEMYQGAGLPLSTICDEFQRGDDGYGFWIEAPPLYPAIASAVLPGFGAGHRQRMEQFARLGTMIVLVRDGADRSKSNGDVRIDRRGRPVIRYRLGASDRRTMVRGITATAQLQLAAGAREVTSLHTRATPIRTEADLASLAGLPSGPNQLALLSAHVNGTCRLGIDPKTSVCTPDGEVRGVPGLYVADGSLLPTALGVNPQETIMAVATVIAGRIHVRRR